MEDVMALSDLDFIEGSIHTEVTWTWVKLGFPNGNTVLHVTW